MRHEPIDISMLEQRHARRNALRRRQAMTAPKRFDRAALPSDAVDAAFADLPTADEPPADGKRNLLGQLAAQVVAIDRQCQQLSRFIQNLDAESIARQ